MQQNISPGNEELQQEPDWVLASYGQRVGAWARLVDFGVGFTLPFVLLLIGDFRAGAGGYLFGASETVKESITVTSDSQGGLEESIEVQSIDREGTGL